MRNGCLIGCGIVILVALPVVWPLVRLAIPRDYGKLAEEGRPILEAVYRYKAEHGLWPLDADSLVPDYLPRMPAKWEYEWVYFGSFRLWRPTGAVREALSYRPDWDGQGAWVVCGEGRPRKVSGPHVDLSAAQLTEDERRLRRLAEFDRRIALRPKEKIHREGKVSYLRDQAMLDEALSACDALLRGDPDDTWLRLAKALMRAEQGQPQEAAEELRHWVTAHPSFASYCCLWYFHAEQDDPGAALEAGETACTFPLPSWTRRDRWPFGRNVHEWVLFAMSAYAYDHGRHDVVLALCRHWGKLREERGYAEESDIAMRAASLLAQGDVDAARARAQLIDDSKALWMPNVKALKQAASRGDTAYVVKFGDCRPELNVFVDYQ